MIGKRTGIDFSKHEVLVKNSDDLLVHYLKKPDTIHDSIKFINTNGIMAVTGDYGNWMFCREFHPSPKGGVSDGYWKEKLQIASTQEHSEYDAQETKRRLHEAINGGAQEYGYIGEKLEQALAYYKECLECVDEHELDYTHFAYRNYPSFMDTEGVIFCKDTKPWLKAVFDGFDEICRRLQNDLSPTT